MMAPTPISSPPLLAAGRNRMAMRGTMVSGKAVPTAARTLPTAPSDSSNLRPVHSTPLVNSSQLTRMMTKLRRNSSRPMEWWRIG